MSSMFSLFGPSPTRFNRWGQFGVSRRNRACRCVSVAAVVIFATIWHVRVTGHLSWTAFATFVLFVFLCLAFGRAFISATAGLVTNRAGLSFQFLCGFFVFNTLLFLLALVSPLGMLTNVSMLSLCALVLTAVGPGRRVRAEDDEVDELPSLLCIMVGGAAATFWCSDAQPPMLIEGQRVVIRLWKDVFIHAREISAFAQAHGVGTIHDIKLAGAPAQLYHFASYLSAASIAVLTGASALEVYASFQLPLGIFLTGLAAFSLIAAIWGGWPALAATVAVVLLPDAYQQGFANRYLSYNFLAQVSPGMLYGVACAAIAWMFILEACSNGKYCSILVGYFFLALCLVYKAHIFVANALLVLIYPCLFFPGLRARWRLVIGTALVGLFAAVVYLSQQFDRVPILRLDGSGIVGYLLLLLDDFDPGMLKTFFTRFFTQEEHSRLLQGIVAVAMIALSTFGMWIAATPLVVALVGRMSTPAVVSFPLLIIANYLVMSVGLAADTHGIGTTDELMNRPLVWAYFVVAAWTAGGAYVLAIGEGPPRSWLARISVLALVCLGLAGPLFLSRNLQTFPARQGYAKYEEFNSIPLCLVRASKYIRDHARPDDIIQDAENDPRFVVSALSERQLFAGKSLFGGSAQEHQERLDGLAAFRGMRNAEALKAYATSQDISWYVLHPGSAVSWPASFLEQPIFDCDGYRVFHFAE